MLHWLQAKLLSWRSSEILLSSQSIGSGRVELLMRVHERHRVRICELQHYISDSEMLDDHPQTSPQENSAGSLFETAPLTAPEVLQHVKDLRINLLVFVCSICKLLEKDAEQEKAIIRTRLYQYLSVSPESISSGRASGDVNDWEAEFDSALARLTLLENTHSAAASSASAPEQQGLGLKPLSVELIEEIMPAQIYASQRVRDNDSEHCSVCLQPFKEGYSQVRIFPSCHHTFHSTCLDTWLTEGNIFFNQHGHRCPICRGTL